MGEKQMKEICGGEEPIGGCHFLLPSGKFSFFRLMGLTAGQEETGTAYAHLLSSCHELFFFSLFVADKKETRPVLWRRV